MPVKLSLLCPQNRGALFYSVPDRRKLSRNGGGAERGRISKEPSIFDLHVTNCLWCIILCALISRATRMPRLLKSRATVVRVDAFFVNCSKRWPCDVCYISPILTLPGGYVFVLLPSSAPAGAKGKQEHEDHLELHRPASGAAAPDRFDARCCL